MDNELKRYNRLKKTDQTVRISCVGPGISRRFPHLSGDDADHLPECRLTGRRALCGPCRYKLKTFLDSRVDWVTFSRHHLCRAMIYKSVYQWRDNPEGVVQCEAPRETRDDMFCPFHKCSKCSTLDHQRRARSKFITSLRCLQKAGVTTDLIRHWFTPLLQTGLYCQRKHQTGETVLLWKTDQLAVAHLAPPGRTWPKSTLEAYDLFLNDCPQYCEKCRMWMDDYSITTKKMTCRQCNPACPIITPVWCNRPRMPPMAYSL